jgi:hypothetical protein
LDGLERGFGLVEFVVGEGVEVGVVVAAVCLFDDWEGLADEWFGVAGVVWERVDESLAAAGGAVGVGVVAGRRSPTPGLTMFAYTAEPGSKSGQALDLLASWTATPDEAAVAETDQDSGHGTGAVARRAKKRRRYRCVRRVIAALRCVVEPP